MRAVSCEPTTRIVIADGRAHRVGLLRRIIGAAPSPEGLTATGTNAGRVSFLAEPDGATAILYRAPVGGGATLLQIKSSSQSWLLPLHSTRTWSDHVGDGLPDALRLHDADDRLRFRHWFTTVADRAAAMPDADLPREITDCSALLRYSYRIALMNHGDRWYKQFQPGSMPVLPSVTQWNYPNTPLGAGLFRVVPVHAAIPQASDFAEYADAKTLYSRNSFRVSRDIRAAKPGDLLFFHQLGPEQQYHSMIVTGDGAEWVVYHTGPDGSGAVHSHGEMRRARITDLLQHPDFRWRPTPGNPNFLGVFRWNLLRED
ncbi:DUF1175 domain-containing protein [Terriglobus aquaticus]|uniref:DUF1175 domain-containing protein n=2 Tax=Terriglobus aquaticus TaxID=940139 RepID=A0ABW9KL51_9BACT